MESKAPPNPVALYEQYFVPAMFRPWAIELLGLAALQSGERVLDVACGTGIVARQAAAQVGAAGRVVAIDINPAMLAFARSLPAAAGAPIDWRLGDATALPLDDRLFDVALCQHGLQFFPDRVAALREMRRVLVTGGRCLVVVLQSISLHPVFEALMTAVAQELSVPVTTVATPFALAEPERLRGLFTDAGFGTVEVISTSITARFPQPERFVPLAVVSSAAAIPAFLALAEPQRATFLESVGQRMQELLARNRSGDVIQFPMFAWVVRARQ